MVGKFLKFRKSYAQQTLFRQNVNNSQHLIHSFVARSTKFLGWIRIVSCTTSLESIYVTPDISGVEIKILGAAAQPLGAKIKILGVLAQPLAWRKGVAHKDGNSWHAAGLHCYAARYMPGKYPNFDNVFRSSYKVN